jgi:hypothetical protein
MCAQKMTKLCIKKTKKLILFFDIFFGLYFVFSFVVFVEIFWTENHVIGYMSTEYLLREFYEAEEYVLSKELAARLGYFFQTMALDGFAEGLSPVIVKNNQISEG